jgi:exodeoxyribonuclease III
MGILVSSQPAAQEQKRRADPLIRPDTTIAVRRDSIRRALGGLPDSSVSRRDTLGRSADSLDTFEWRTIENRAFGVGEKLVFDVSYGAELTVVSVYLPSGSSGPHRQASKFRFLDAFLPHLRQLRKRNREIVLCGDWNIAHREIDLKNWRANRRNSGFLPEERAWLTRVFDELGFVDVFRRIDPRPDRYTWWSNRGQAWAKNVGWRIDYQIATPGIAARATAAAIYTNRRFSDHAPLVIDYACELR